MKALSVDTYDGASNYYYGLANGRLGRHADAKDGFEIAAQSPEYRGAAWTELAKLSLSRGGERAALAYAENLELAGRTDWRLPNAKELHSIVDYARSPDTTDSAAIEPVFECTPITVEGGDVNYPFYWASTTHAKSYSGRPEFA